MQNRVVPSRPPKSRPARSIVVLLATLLVAAGGWTWLNREWVRSKLLADEEESLTTIQE